MTMANVDPADFRARPDFLTRTPTRIIVDDRPAQASKDQPMDQMAVQALQDIVLNHGRNVINDERRCASLLEDRCRDEKSRGILLQALKEGVPQRLLALSTASLTELAIEKAGAELAAKRALSADAARWAVATWAAALGLAVDCSKPAIQADKPSGANGSQVASEQNPENWLKLCGVIFCAILLMAAVYAVYAIAVGLWFQQLVPWAARQNGIFGAVVFIIGGLFVLFVFQWSQDNGQMFSAAPAGAAQPSPAASPAMDAAVAARLKELIARDGAGLLDDRRRCEQLLREHHREAGREVAALLGALEARVPQQLIASPGTLTETALRKLAGRLNDEQGMDAAAAQWAVKTWAGALDPRNRGG